jgi:hypothetical protein
MCGSPTGPPAPTPQRPGVGPTRRSVGFRRRPAAHLARLLALTLTASACQGDPAPPPGTEILRADSAGVEIVTLRLVEDALPHHVATSEAEVEIGVPSGEAGYLMDRVTGAVRLSDGGIAVLDAGWRELRFYDEGGRFLGSAGGAGDGPGEFRSPGRLALLPGDTLVVFDRGHQRMSVFTGRGDFVRSHPVAPGEVFGIWEAEGVTDRGDLLVTTFVGEDPQVPGAYFAPEVVGLFQGGEGRWTPVDSVAGTEAAIVERDGRPASAIIPFGRKSDFAAAGEHVFVLDGLEGRSIRVFAADGRLIRLLRVELPRAPVDARLTERWIESFFALNADAFADERVAEHWRYGFARVTPPAQVPLFRSLTTDREGNVCAERHGPEETTPPTYLCLSPEGQVLRRVTFPEGLIRTGFPRQDPGVEIGADHLLGAWRDGTGVSVVRLYRLEAADPSLEPEAR